LGIDRVPFADLAALLWREFQSDGLRNGPDHILLDQEGIFETAVQRP
jgi:hypothetical protein